VARLLPDSVKNGAVWSLPVAGKRSQKTRSASALTACEAAFCAFCSWASAKNGARVCCALAGFRFLRAVHTPASTRSRAQATNGQGASTAFLLCYP